MSPKYSMLSIIGVVALAVGVMVGVRYMQSQSHIVETKRFECGGMAGFTFEYPVFRGWEVTATKANNDGSCSLFLSDAALVEAHRMTEVAPQILVRVVPEVNLLTLSQKNPIQENPNGVSYVRQDDGIYDFGITKGLVSLETLGTSDELGFSRDIFFKQVVQTFEIVR